MGKPGTKTIRTRVVVELARTAVWPCPRCGAEHGIAVDVDLDRDTNDLAQAHQRWKRIEVSCERHPDEDYYVLVPISGLISTESSTHDDALAHVDCLQLPRQWQRILL